MTIDEVLTNWKFSRTDKMATSSKKRVEHRSFMLL